MGYKTNHIITPPKKLKIQVCKRDYRRGLDLSQLIKQKQIMIRKDRNQSQDQKIKFYSLKRLSLHIWTFLRAAAQNSWNCLQLLARMD